MTADPLPIRAALAGTHADPDDRRAVLRGIVDDALGPLAGRATATVDEVAALYGVSRGAAFDAVHAGRIPSLRVGRRILVPVPALAAALLAAQNGNGENATRPASAAEAGPVLTA
jgi:excisionase family DNA binding protein